MLGKLDQQTGKVKIDFSGGCFPGSMGDDSRNGLETFLVILGTPKPPALDLREREKYIANSVARVSAVAKRHLAHASAPLVKSFYSTYYGSR